VIVVAALGCPIAEGGELSAIPGAWINDFDSAVPNRVVLQENRAMHAQAWRRAFAV
jgi:hypothetical protein